MIMPEGDTARKQLFSAMQIVSRLGAMAQTGVTPEFVRNDIINPQGLSHRFAAQAYGPAPFAAQAERLVENPLPGGAPGETFKPVTEGGYALGMRAATQEEAYLILHSGEVENLFIKGGDAAATLLTSVEDKLSHKMSGKNTALESLDGLHRLTTGIVLAVDATTGNTKPIRLGTAKDIFNLQNLTWIFVDHEGQVIDQRVSIPLATPSQP